MVLSAKRRRLDLEGISGWSVLPALRAIRTGYVCCVKWKTEAGRSQVGGCAEVRESFGDDRPLLALLVVDAGSLHLAFQRRV